MSFCLADGVSVASRLPPRIAMTNDQIPMTNANGRVLLIGARSSVICFSLWLVYHQQRCVICSEHKALQELDRPRRYWLSNIDRSNWFSIGERTAFKHSLAVGEQQAIGDG